MKKSNLPFSVVLYRGVTYTTQHGQSLRIFHDGEARFMRQSLRTWKGLTRRDILRLRRHYAAASFLRPVQPSQRGGMVIGWSAQGHFAYSLVAQHAAVRS